MELMEAKFGFFKSPQAQPGVTHSPFAALPTPPAAHLIPNPNRHQFHGDGLLCSCSTNYFPAEATPRVYEAKQRSGGKQSMAARERRRKVTAKTHELAKLVPGAHKMNTAQMLQAASKYVKFLQAQLALLQRIEIPACKHQGRELPVLLASLAIQEKLYLEDKCLAPKKFLQLL